jgi:hypothetical protein
MAPAEITLNSGESIKIDPDEWPILASPVWSSPKHFLEHRLTIRQHPDGRVLVTGVVEKETKVEASAGELLASSSQLRHAVKNVTNRLGLAEWMAEAGITAARQAKIRRPSNRQSD